MLPGVGWLQRTIFAAKRMLSIIRSEVHPLNIERIRLRCRAQRSHHTYHCESESNRHQDRANVHSVCSFDEVSSLHRDQ